MKRILAALLALAALSGAFTVAPRPAAAITYTVECVRNPAGSPIRHGSGTSVTSASSVCFRNIANSVYNSSCVSGVVITGNHPTKVGRTGIIYKGDASQGWPWYCGNGVASANVISYIP